MVNFQPKQTIQSRENIKNRKTVEFICLNFWNCFESELFYMIKWKKNGTFVVFIGFPHVELNASLTQVLMYLEQISTCAKSRFWQETLKNAQKTGSRKLAREMPLTFIKSKISVFSARYMSKFCRLELLENCTRQTPSKSVMDIQNFPNSFFRIATFADILEVFPHFHRFFYHTPWNSLHLCYYLLVDWSVDCFGDRFARFLSNNHSTNAVSQPPSSPSKTFSTWPWQPRISRKSRIKRVPLGRSQSLVRSRRNLVTLRRLQDLIMLEPGTVCMPGVDRRRFYDGKIGGRTKYTLHFESETF